MPTIFIELNLGAEHHGARGSLDREMFNLACPLKHVIQLGLCSLSEEILRSLALGAGCVSVPLTCSDVEIFPLQLK
jgi:hypothetical protein